MKAFTFGLIGLAWIAAVCTFAHAEDNQPEGPQEFSLLRLDGHLVRWPRPTDGSQRKILYRVLTETVEFANARNCSAMSAVDTLLSSSNVPRADFDRELEAAFSQWEAVTDLKFAKAADHEKPQIVVGAQVVPVGWAFANVFYDPLAMSPYKPITQALICLNPNRPWKVGFDGKLDVYDLRYTLVHEIGHAIGLDHPPKGRQIMAQRYEENLRELQSGDVLGATALYGATRKTLSRGAVSFRYSPKE